MMASPGAAGSRVPDRAEIEAEIRRILVAELGVAVDRLNDAGSATPLLGQGIGLDSMEALVLVSGLERAFGFETTDDELTAQAFTTVGVLADKVSAWTAREVGR